jgi:hypothetical protein
MSSGFRACQSALEREESGRFLKKAAQKLLVVWASGSEATTPSN